MPEEIVKIPFGNVPEVVSVDVLGLDGSVETTAGTQINPIWTVDPKE
jgi:hypothetical protein